MYQNEVTIIGNLTKTPELKAFGNDGGRLTNLNIAVNTVYYDKETKEKKESVEFISVLVFGKTAENCASYLIKGQKVFVRGKIKNKVEQTPDGNRYHTGIVAEQVQFGSKPQGQTGETKTEYKGKSTFEAPDIDYPNDDINPDDDDIPF